MGAMSQARQADFLRCREQLKHYENFNVVSYFVPGRLRPHFWAIYAFCRGVDDLGDEYSGDRLAALQAFEEELRRAFENQARTPEFRALAETIRLFHLPIEDFLALIEANRRDQVRSRYLTFDDLLEYCRHSADPVGHLVLALFGFRDDERRRLADAVSTGLQLTNFWQDLDRDLAAGRCYLPEEDCRRFGVSASALKMRPSSEAVRQLIAFEVDRAEVWLKRGARLETMVPKRLAWQLKLYRLGGQAILNAIRAQGCDPMAGRPEVSRAAKLGIVWRVWFSGEASQP